MQLMSTEQLVKPSLTVLLYGLPKAGKTTFAGTMPRPLFISLEPGMVSLARQQIDYVEPKSWTEILWVISELQSGASTDTQTVKFMGKEYSSVVIDPLNEFYKLVMSGVLSLSKGREMPSIQDWGLAGDRVERAIKEFCKLPVHVLFTILEDIDKDEFTGRILAKPLLPGKLAGKTPALVDFYWHALTEPKKDGGVNYVIATSTESIYPAGGRSGSIKLDQHEQPNFTRIYNKLTTKQ